MKTEIGKLHDEMLVQLATDPKMQILDPLPMLHTISEVLAKTLDVEQTSIWRVDPGNSQLIAMDVYHHEMDKHLVFEPINIRLVSDLFSEMEGNRFLDIFNLSQDPLANELKGGKWHTSGLKSILLIPMRGSGRLDGILRIDQIHSRRIWTSEEINFACQVADLVALSINHFELRRRDKEVETYQALTKEVQERENIDLITKFFAECLAMIMQADATMIFSCDPVHRQLWVTHAFQPPSGFEGLRLDYREGAAGMVADHGHTLIINNYAEYPGREEAFEEDQPFTHLIAEPVLCEDNLVAVLQVVRQNAQQPFSDHDENLIHQMSSWYGMVLEQHEIQQRLDMLKVYRRTLQRMAEVGQFASGVDDLLNTTLDYCESMFLSGMLVVKVDHWSQCRGLPNNFKEDINNILESADHWSTSPLIVESIYQADQVHPVVVEAMKQSNINAFMFLPIMVEDQQSGYFLVACPFAHEWTEEEIALMEFAARYLALETRRIQAVRENQERTELAWQVNSLGKKLSHALSYAETVYVVGNTAVEMMQPDQLFMLVRSSKNQLKKEFSYGLPDRVLDDLLGQNQQQLEMSFFSIRFPKLCSNPSELALPGPLETYLQQDGIQSLKILPFIYQDQTVGVIVALYRNMQQWPDYEKDMLKVFSRTAVLSLQNAWMMDEMEKGYLDVAMALANAMDSREKTMDDLSIKIANWAEATARKLGCSDEDLQNIRLAALLHDIGKSEIPETILRKPGPLSQDEWKVIQKAPARGESLLQPLSRYKEVASIIRSIYEKYDGNGYPDRLKGQAIPLGSRILAVAVAYGSMIDQRPYRKALTWQQAVTELRENKGKQFDPRVVDQFVLVVQPKMADV